MIPFQYLSSNIEKAVPYDALKYFVTFAAGDKRERDLSVQATTSFIRRTGRNRGENG